MVILGTLWVLARGASALQPTTGNTQEQKGTASTTSSKPPVVPTVPHPDDAIENPVLDEADEKHIINLASHIALKYNHYELDGGGLNWYRNISRNRESLAVFDGLKIAVPALYIAGDRDVVLAFPGMDEVIANLSASVPFLQQTVLLSRCGHWTQQERPQEVNSAIIGFLKGIG